MQLTRLQEEYLLYVEATTTGNITINNSQRNFVKENSESSLFFFTDNDNNTTSSTTKSNVDEQIDDSSYDAPDMRQKVRFTFDSPQQFHRELLLTVDNQTTMGYDRMYDGISFGETEDDMKWVIEEEQGVIQAIPEVQDFVELPLVITTATAGVSYIKISHIDNENLTSEIYLKDNVQNSMTNLKDEIVSIQLDAGEYNNRFSIVFKAGESDETSNENKPISIDINEGDTTSDDETNTPNDTDTSNDSETNPSDDTDTSNNNETNTSDDNENENPNDDVFSINIEDEENETSLIYDSTNNYLTISKDVTTVINQVKIYNLLGQIVEQWKPILGTDYIELPVSNVSTGTYIAYLETETGFISKKIIIN